MFQKGTEVTGEDEEVVSGQGQILREESPGIPYCPEALAPAFSQGLLNRDPHEIHCGRGEEATLESIPGHRGGASIRDFDWTTFLVACALALCSKGPGPRTDPCPG